MGVKSGNHGTSNVTDSITVIRQKYFFCLITTYNILSAEMSNSRIVSKRNVTGLEMVLQEHNVYYSSDEKY